MDSYLGDWKAKKFIHTTIDGAPYIVRINQVVSIIEENADRVLVQTPTREGWKTVEFLDDFERVTE